MKKIIFSILLFISSLKAVCTATPANITQEITALDWTAIMPIRIGGISIAPGRMPDAVNQVDIPVCVCPAPPPIIIRVGIPIGLYNPTRIIDSVKDSLCFPSVGVQIPAALPNNGSKANPNTTYSTFFQTHMIMFSPFQMLDILLDIACIQAPSALDVMYITEIDPMWNDDTLSALIQPEAVLFGNPVTNLACIADSISSMADFSNPALFWCKGSWGNAYPMTGRVNSGDYVQASASAASELIYKLHREGLSWATWGIPALCAKYPLPIWEKDAYRMQLIFPVPWIANSIGKTGLMWDFAKNIPFSGDNFSYIIFKKRDCCAF